MPATSGSRRRAWRRRPPRATRTARRPPSSGPLVDFMRPFRPKVTDKSLFGQI
jgi:hypothetical protein